MKLTCVLKKRFLHRETVALAVNGTVVASLVSGAEVEMELPERERYYLALATEKAYDGITVLTAERDEVHLTVTKEKKAYSLDTEGAKVEVLSLGRLLSVLCDEGQLPYLCAWERCAFFVLLYLDLNRRDALLESPHLFEIKEALAEMGETEIVQRMARAIDACELTLPLDPMKKLTPEEETAMVESYHIFWSEAETVPEGEDERVLLRLYDFIYENTKN